MDETIKTIADASGAIGHPFIAALVVGFLAYLALFALGRYPSSESTSPVSTGAANATGMGAIANTGPGATVTSNVEHDRQGPQDASKR